MASVALRRRPHAFNLLHQLNVQKKLSMIPDGSLEVPRCQVPYLFANHFDENISEIFLVEALQEVSSNQVQIH